MFHWGGDAQFRLFSEFLSVIFVCYLLGLLSPSKHILDACHTAPVQGALMMKKLALWQDTVESTSIRHKGHVPLF